MEMCTLNFPVFTVHFKKKRIKNGNSIHWQIPSDITESLRRVYTILVYSTCFILCVFIDLFFFLTLTTYFFLTTNLVINRFSVYSIMRNNGIFTIIFISIFCVISLFDSEGAHWLKKNKQTNMALSRVHISVKVQHSPLIQSSFIEYVR